MAALRGTKPKKPVVLGVRLTLDTKAALDRESAKSGRAVSEIAARWIDEGAAGGRPTSELEGIEAASTLRAMAKFAQILETIKGPPSSGPAARAALVAGLMHLAVNAVPGAAPSEAEIELAGRAAELREACAGALEKASQWTAESDESRWALRRLEHSLGRVAAGYGLDGEATRADLHVITDDRPDYPAGLREDLKAVRAALWRFEEIAAPLDREKRLAARLGREIADVMLGHQPAEKG